MLSQGMDARCEKRMLAEHGPFNVQACGCGALHLTLGFVTGRLEPSAYRELSAVVTDALVALRDEIAGTLN